MKDKILNSSKKTKDIIYMIFKVLFTTIFSLTIFLDSTLIFKQDLRGSINDINFTDITIKNIIIFIIAWIITFIVLTIIEFVITKIEKEICIKDEKTKSRKVFFIIFGIIILLWMPYILTYFPGGIFSDTQTSIRQCLHLQSYDNINPLAYTLIIKACLAIGDIFNSSQIGINVFGICQITIMAAILSYFVYWLYKKNFSNIVLVLVTLFFGFFKLFPMYALSIWKDTPFCLALFLYIINIAEIVYQNGKNLNSKKEIIIYSLLFVAISFLRNNGLYVVLATTILLLIIYRKNKILKFTISTIITFIIVVIIQRPIFNALHLNETTGTWNSVMINQIFYVKVTDGNINQEQDELINKMCKTEKLKEVYAPLLLDATTVTPEFNKQFVKTHLSEIKQLWIELFFQNPIDYIKAYLLNTLGFWDVNKVFPDAYISNFMWPGTEDIIDVHQTDYIKEWTGQSIIDKIQITKLYSSATFLFIMFASMLFTIKKKNYKNLLIYLPALFTWGTIVLATPIAFSLRYVYILVLIIPFDFIIPFLLNNKKQDL